jgi:hypothetical protein
MFDSRGFSAYGIIKMNFDIFYKKTLCLGNTAITSAYEVGLKSFLYEKVSTRKVTSEFNNLGLFQQILESQNSKGKIDFFALLYFFIFLFFLDPNLYWIKLLE